jgi:hypothetical protein
MLEKEILSFLLVENEILKLLCEIRKIMQYIKEEFNKGIEILKKNQIEILEVKSSIIQIKDQLKTL